MAAACGTENLSLATDLSPAPPPELSAVESLLREHPGRFEFFQAVRLLLRICGGYRLVAGFVNPEDEPIRFAAEPGLAFPPGNIDEIAWEGGAAHMNVTFMGLTGPAGVLPRCYSAFLLSRLRDRDRGLKDFLDIFNHRFISLFYRAWEKHRFGVAYEREGVDKVSKYLTCLIGLGTPELDRLPAIAPQRLLSYAGLLSLQPRSATALKQLLEDYFDIPVDVEELVGVWRPLDPEDQCLLNEDDSFPAQLGVTAVVGDAVWDQQSRIRLKLGPLSEAQYLSFLPSGSAWEPLRELTRFFCGLSLEVEVQLILNRDEVPRCDLGREDDAGPRLGWFTWIRSALPFDRSPGDTVLLLA